ncbi:hypothetical protein BJF78_30395 [Pseudonocardia sp. CNS-139]|nr:hypothetical protein BJF78_30395 [Pseudonocardia sp. CNS-139]
MDLDLVMRTTGTTRYLTPPDDVADDVLCDAVAVARFGPQGGNRQPVRWVFVRNPDTKGVGTAVTTSLVNAEPQVRELLGIPRDFLTAAHAPRRVRTGAGAHPGNGDITAVGTLGTAATGQPRTRCLASASRPVRWAAASQNSAPATSPTTPCE